MNKTFRRRFISVIMTLVLVLTGLSCGFLNMGAQATGGVKDKLDSFMAKYPSGSRWTSTFDGGIQCFGFARLAIYNVFGKTSSGAYRRWEYDGTSTAGMNVIGSITSFSASNVKSLLSNAKCGDVLQFNRTKQHTMIVYSVESDGVKIYDCNWDSNCGISFRKSSFGAWSGRNSTKLTLLRSNNYSEVDGKASEPLYTDSRYPTPFKAYNLANAKTPAYDYVSGSSVGYIYGSDECTVQAVYTNGWCKVLCPWTGYSNGRVVYCLLSTFLNTGYTPSSKTVSAQTTTFTRSDAATSYGYIGAGDNVVIVGSSGSYSQVIYPLTAGGYKCAWASLATAPVDSSYNVPFKCRIISTVKVKCYNDVNYTSSPGNIYPEDDCVITAIYDNGKVQCQCPWSDGSTKTVYIDKSAFINSSSKPKNSKAVKYAKTYLRTDMSTNIGWIDVGDAIQIVATSGDKTQIIYPADVGKRCAWVYTSDLTKTYKISYNANGGTGAPSAQTKTSGVGLTLSSTKPSYDGHTFLGWATSASATSASYSAGGAFNTDADTTLYAIWRANQYNISYNANGGTGAPEAQTKIHGTAVTISKTIPALEGYTFMGWSADKTATSATYSAGSSYTENKSIELFAVWKANTYNVSYNANGGTNAPTTQTKIHDIDLKLSDDIPAKNGYTFVGWSLSADGTEANYQPGDYYYDNSSSTLYAVWSKIETPKVKISAESKTAEAGATVSVPVKLTENNGIAYIKFTAEYDADVFELVGATNGSIFATADFDRSGNNFQWSSSDNNMATGILATLNFRVKDVVSAGEYQIGINVKACYNSSEISADVNTTNGSITVNKTTIDENAPQIVVSNERGNLGKTVDVTVSLANNPGIIGTRFTLSYDTSKLSLTAVNNGSVFADSTFISSDSISAMPYTVYWEDALASSNNTSNGTLVTFTFKVLDNAETGSTPIEITVDDGSTFNYDLDNVKFVAVNGSVDISNRTPGDVNGDGVVNSKDLVILRRYLANWNNVEIDERNSDVNGDGVVNTKDVVIIKRYLAGWNVTLV